jgi:predicted ATPase
MSLLKSFSINTTKKMPFPFNVPAVKFAQDIFLDSPVVIFVGEYQITDDGVKKVAFTNTDHYRVTKTFLDNPEVYLRHF